MTAIDADALFKSLASRRGWSVSTEGKALAVRSGNTCLRLRHDVPDGLIVLEITHGSKDGEFWLELCTERNADESISRREMPTLAESIDYGLDLMKPAIGP